MVSEQTILILPRSACGWRGVGLTYRESQAGSDTRSNYEEEVRSNEEERRTKRRSTRERAFEGPNEETTGTLPEYTEYPPKSATSWARAQTRRCAKRAIREEKEPWPKDWDGL